MLCKELQYGDWCCNKHGFPMQITNVGDDYAYATFEGNEGDPWEYDDKDEQPQPIPLTPEILEKNEWKSDNNISECLGIEVFASEKNKCCVEFDGEDEYSFNTYERWEDTDYYGAPMDWGYRYITSIYHLRYVHELQHALRLCGLDELADNFKV